MQITIDTALPLNDREAAVLRLLIGDTTPAQGLVLDDVELQAVQAKQPAQEPKKRTRKAAEPVPAPQAQEPAPEPAAEPEPAPEPEPEPEEDLIGTEAPTVTKAEMIALATKLVSTGGSAKVKAALKNVGADRITKIDDPADIAAVYQELSA